LFISLLLFCHSDPFGQCSQNSILLTDSIPILFKFLPILILDSQCFYRFDSRFRLVFLIFFL
jgi:hypothetical protein